MEELKNWATSNVIHPDDLARVVDSWKHSVETGQPYDLELRQRRADGGYRWFQSRALPTRDTEARFTGWDMWLTLIHDRTPAGGSRGVYEREPRRVAYRLPGVGSAT